jgi:hypothetical protein
MPGTNTLVYYGNRKIAAVMSFMIQAPGSTVVNHWTRNPKILGLNLFPSLPRMMIWLKTTNHQYSKSKNVQTLVFLQKNLLFYYLMFSKII